MENVAGLAAESNIRKELLRFMLNAVQIVLEARTQGPAVCAQVLPQLRAAALQFREKATEPIPPQPWMSADVAAAATRAQRVVVQEWFEQFDAMLAGFFAEPSPLDSPEPADPPIG